MTTNNAYDNLFPQALSLAQALHGKQRRKGAGEKPIPYMTHLLSVAALVGEMGGNEDDVIAAILHDAIEDHARDGQTERTIQGLFGYNVAELIAGVTNTFDSKELPLELTKPLYITQIERGSVGVHRIKMADCLHNSRSTVMNLRADGGTLVWQRFRGGRDGTLWYYRSLAEMLERVLPGEYSRELTATVYLMHSLA